MNTHNPCSLSSHLTNNTHISQQTFHMDTICAPCTPAGGAISVLRISGNKAIDIVSKIFQPTHKKQSSNINLADQPGYSLLFGNIYQGEDILDEVLLSLFRSPHSYTGEDIVEISCHGSQYIVNSILELLTKHGCRMAENGEFTKRAFLNGKMDLCQAEAVADLIASESAAAHHMAISQLKGGFSRKLSMLRDKLLRLTTLMELELDFSDHEDLQFADRTELISLAQNINTEVSQLAESFHLGNAVKNGIPVTIVGETNAGKSSLLNALLREDRAIVSNIHGTTRDIIEGKVNIQGTLFRFIDTAGIRESKDTIERLGIEKTFQKMEKTSVILWVIDVTQPKTIKHLLEVIRQYGHDKQVVVILNKADLLTSTSDNSSSLLDLTTSTLLSPVFRDLPYPKWLLSAHSLFNNETHVKNTNISQDISRSNKPEITYIRSLSEFEQQLCTIAAPTTNMQQLIITNARHYEALRSASVTISRVINGLQTSLPTDLISQDLRETLHHLSEITGSAITTDEVLSTVFSKFCIGK